MKRTIELIDENYEVIVNKKSRKNELLDIYDNHLRTAEESGVAPLENLAMEYFKTITKDYTNEERRFVKDYYMKEY